jgi:xylulokinase
MDMEVIMATILGIDLGTSSVKAMLLDVDNGVIDVINRNYGVDIPQINYAEQSPEMWWEATISILRTLRDRQEKAFADIAVIGLSGQMHGIIVTDDAGKALRPAIIWLDQRSSEQLSQIGSKVTFDEMGEILHNRVFTGFAFPSLLWIYENEPETYSRIHKILQPKDYIRLKMTGMFGTDFSDASATAIFNTGKKEWAWDIIERFNIPKKIFPDCHEATEIAGVITSECAKLTGLNAGIPVIFGSGDQPAQSIGNGAVKEGLIVSNIGTGGQISAYTKNDKYDSKLRTHTFCHSIDHAYTIFGATLCSGMSLNWLKNKILNIDDFNILSSMTDEIPPSSEGLIYLPYLSGERTPHMNQNAKGMFFGLKLCQDHRHFARAVMEGVTYSLKDSLSIFEEMGIAGDRIIASGGGATSPVWLQIQADIFEKKVQVCRVKEQACLGACIMAGIGVGIYKNAQQACEKYVEFDEKVYEPIQEHVLVYREAYAVFRKLYERTVDLMELV